MHWRGEANEKGRKKHAVGYIRGGRGEEEREQMQGNEQEDQNWQPREAAV